TIQGRSDATLNRKGIRIGTAEIYAVLDTIEGISDGLIVNLEQPDGSDIMPLFVVLNAGYTLEATGPVIRRELRQQCSPRHVPDHIFSVTDIPYTLSGKKMEVPVKKALIGTHTTQAPNQDAIRNPRAMDAILALRNRIFTKQG
ncbi:MAG: acetoacetate--CoA ligase, partial [Cyclobacteriaceae bacterium]|nr:acetoacetate--CoA ligase [Cyclobacteriaceae bacterium]